MTYEEMKAAKMREEGMELEPTVKDKVMVYLNSPEGKKIQSGFKDGIFYAVGYTVGKSTGNKALKLLMDFMQKEWLWMLCLTIF